MNKSELIDKLSDSIGGKLSKKEISSVVDSMLNIVIDSVASGDKICIANFGTFETSHRKARNSYNPQSNERFMVPSKRIAVFRPSSHFKQNVNKP